MVGSEIGERKDGVHSILATMVGPQVTDTQFQKFVAQFVAAWTARDAKAFVALWHPDGVLHYPLTDRPIAGREIGLLNDRQKEAAPDLVWRLVDWTARHDLLMLEWYTVIWLRVSALTGGVLINCGLSPERSSRNASTRIPRCCGLRILASIRLPC